MSENPISKCPVMSGAAPYTAAGSMANQRWWPNQLNLKALSQNSPLCDPMGEEFNYVEEFKTLDLEEVKKDIEELMTNSQDWWPADYGHYGRLSSAWRGTVPAPTASRRPRRRGAGHQRFAPLNSWPDNANLDKARRCCGRSSRSTARKISWADLMILAGNVRLEIDGLQDLRFRRRA